MSRVLGGIVELHAYRERNYTAACVEICRMHGYEPAFVCTPQELMGDLSSG